MSVAGVPVSRRRRRGFTLIELMIVVVVLGVLAAIALPSFQDSIRKSRRSEAFTAIAALQQAQERWRSQNAQYTTTLSDLGWTTSTTPNGLYTMQLGAVAGENLKTAYVVSASAVAGSSQASDRNCSNLSVRVRGGNIEYAGCQGCTDFVYAATNRCWAQ